MTLTVQLKIVARARQIISDRDRWTKGTDARGRRGAQLGIADPHARQFSAFGALARAAHEHVNDLPRAIGLARAIAENIRWSQRLPVDLDELNDHSALDTGHVAVLSAFDSFVFDPTIHVSMR